MESKLWSVIKQLVVDVEALLGCVSCRFVKDNVSGTFLYWQASALCGTRRAQPQDISQLRTIVGAVMTIGLILSVLALIISAIVWGFGANSSNPHLASRGKIGVLVSCGAAVICGASVTLINFFWNVGQQV